MALSFPALQDLHRDIPQGTAGKSRTATVITAGGYLNILNGVQLDSTVTISNPLISSYIGCWGRGGLSQFIG